MSQSTKTFPGPWQGSIQSMEGEQDTAGGDSLSTSHAIYDRALHMGRFRFGWSAVQRDFLQHEVSLWSSATCRDLGAEVAGISDRLVWELLPLEQAALCRFRVHLMDQLLLEEVPSEPLQSALGQLRKREISQQREYEQLAVVVQSVAHGREREIHNAWFLDVLTTRAASQWNGELMKVGLLALAQLLLNSTQD